MSSLVSAPNNTKPITKPAKKKASNNAVHSFSDLFKNNFNENTNNSINNNINENTLDNIWIFNNDVCLAPQTTAKIEYQITADAHCFLIHPEHLTGPVIFLNRIDSHFKSSEKNNSTHFPRTKTIITVAAGAPLTLIECYAHQINFSEESVSNTNIILQDKAQLQHIVIQKGFHKSRQSLHINVAQLSRSQYQGSAFSFDLNSQKTTIDLHLNGPFAKTKFHALMALKDKQKATLSLTTHHQHSDSESSLMVRGLVNDAAQGEFSGKIIVNEGAIHSQAQLENKNLLLSEQAEMITRPLLEVYNDDIQCSHGATVGQLDTEALFYLKSRGIPEHIAKKMLIDAFIEPVVADLPSVILPFLGECIHEY